MNWSTRLRRWVRIRTPPVRDPSTKPSAATVLPEPVACSNQKRRLAPGSSGISGTASTSVFFKTFRCVGLHFSEQLVDVTLFPLLASINIWLASTSPVTRSMLPITATMLSLHPTAPRIQPQRLRLVACRDRPEMASRPSKGAFKEINFS